MDVRRTRTGWGSRRGLLSLAAGAAAAATVVLTACGSQAADTSASHPSGQPTARPTAPPIGQPGGPAVPVNASAPMCSALSSVSRAVIKRTNAFPANHPHFSFPATVTVTDAARARALATSVCGLPAQSRGALACPVDLGISYQLAFSAAKQDFPLVSVQAGGCQAVTGAGNARTANSPFWTTLGGTVGVHGASLPDMEGMIAAPKSGHVMPTPVAGGAN